jgi:hypothetical protein
VTDLICGGGWFLKIIRSLISEHGQSSMSFLLAFSAHPACTVNVPSWASPCLRSKEIISMFAADLLAGMLTCTRCYGALSKTTMGLIFLAPTSRY